MARPEPNIISQKCGNGRAGAPASTVISCAAGGESSRGEDSSETEPSSRTIVDAKQSRNIFMRLPNPREHSKSVWENLPTRVLPGVWGTRWQVTALRKRKRRGGAPPGKGSLEAEAGSQRDDAGRKTSRNRAEVSALNVVRDSGRVEVQIVEQVVRIHPQLNPGVFSEDSRFGQPKALGQCQVHALISREIPRIAMNSRDWRKRSAEHA